MAAPLKIVCITCDIAFNETAEANFAFQLRIVFTLTITKRFFLSSDANKNNHRPVGIFLSRTQKWLFIFRPFVVFGHAMLEMLRSGQGKTAQWKAKEQKQLNQYIHPFIMNNQIFQLRSTRWATVDIILREIVFGRCVVLNFNYQKLTHCIRHYWTCTEWGNRPIDDVQRSQTV